VPFTSLGLDTRLLEGVRDLGFSETRPIQSAVIPLALAGHDLIACAETGTWIELNASPNRFDMDWRLWPYAKSKGVKCVIDCDAHRREHAGFLRLGAGIARKGWLTKEDVINTLPLEALLKELGKKRAK
jgi:histidinol phosphatase-like PHP family hydrolase